MHLYTFIASTWTSKESEVNLHDRLITFALRQSMWNLAKVTENDGYDACRPINKIIPKPTTIKNNEKVTTL